MNAAAAAAAPADPAGPELAPTPAHRTLVEAERLVADGRVLDALDLLHRANQISRDADLECRLAELRYQAFGHLPAGASRFAEWPVPVHLTDAERAEPAQIPQIAPADLTGESLRRAILRHGSAHVPGLLDADRVQWFRDAIEHVLALRNANTRGTPIKQHGSWVCSLPLPQPQGQSLARNWVAGDGGILACDSPRVLEAIFSTYESLGLDQVLTDYLGERPVLSANKATLRRARLDGKTDWHQDGAFLGTQQGIRAINVWITLTDCGTDAPGMDLVPKRFESIQETGTGGSYFDWAVGPQTVATLSADAPVVRPQYRAGDAMFFDDLFLHRTALDETMTRTRHAIESWFFAPTDYPDGQVPLVW